MKTNPLVLAAGIDTVSLFSACSQLAPVNSPPAASSNVPLVATKQDCPPPPLVLPRDYGPRVSSTPYLKRLRKEHYEAQVQACQEVPM